MSRARTFDPPAAAIIAETAHAATPPRRSWLARTAGACHDHRRLVVVAWVLALVAMTVIAGSLGSRTPQNGRLPGTDSQRAYDVMHREFPSRVGESGTVVFFDRRGLTSPAKRASIGRYLDRLHRQNGIDAVGSPLDHPDQISADGRTAFASLDFSDTPSSPVDGAVTSVVASARAMRAEGIEVDFGGQVFSTGKMPASEVFGLIAAGIILLVAFGSVVAAGLPITTAVLSIGIALASVTLWSHVLTTPGFTSSVASMIGIGVGIDYALFIVSRYRDALARLEPREAMLEAMSTAGRAVVFAGATVVVSLLGMLLIGLPFLYGLAVGTAWAVVVAVLAAITLLPALLGFAGRRIDALSVHRRRRQRTRLTLGTRWSRVVQRHPVAGTIIGLAVLAALAVPSLALHLGVSDLGNEPAGSTVRVAYDRMAGGFGAGFNGTFDVVAELPRGGSPKALERLRTDLAHTQGVAEVSRPRVSASGRAAAMTLVPDSSPQSARTEQLLSDLRGHTVPTATAGTGMVVHIGGSTASDADFTTVMGDRLPGFMAAVLGLSFLLLLVVFRSVLVPLKAVVLNLLSIGAAYGVLVMVFQWGWFSGIFHVSPGPIEPWAPMMLFAITFGLSMDYEVFLLSRIAEEYHRSGDNTRAVAHGLASTARVITAAAAIMICVFATFVTGDERALELVGLGLACAVLFDATIVRMLLVPATMELLGERNWWLPRFLDRRLPELSLD